MVAFVVVTGILYFGREVLIPLAAVDSVELLVGSCSAAARAPQSARTLAITLMVGLSCCVMGGLIWLSAAQFLNLAASLPEVQEKHSVQGCRAGR